jgi:hypothetical protein
LNGAVATASFGASAQAGIVVTAVSVVALFDAEMDDAIPANRGRTCIRAAILLVFVRVVTFFDAFMNDAVTAQCENAFDTTFIGVVGISVVTLFFAVYDAVTASGHCANIVFADLADTVLIVFAGLAGVAGITGTSAVNIGLFTIANTVIAGGQLADAVDTHAALAV